MIFFVSLWHLHRSRAVTNRIYFSSKNHYIPSCVRTCSELPSYIRAMIYQCVINVGVQYICPRIKTEYYKKRFLQGKKLPQDAIEQWLKSIRRILITKTKKQAKKVTVLREYEKVRKKLKQLSDLIWKQEKMFCCTRKKYCKNQYCV